MAHEEINTGFVTPEDLQRGIDAYLSTVETQIVKVGMKKKKGNSAGEKGGPFDSEEYTEAAGVPTLTGLLVYLGLLERDWMAMQANPQLNRICEMALMRIDSRLTTLSLQGAVDTTFSKDYLRKDIPAWRKLANEQSKGPGGLLGGATINGPLKIEIQVVKAMRNPDEDMKLSEASREQLEELVLGEEPLKLGLGIDQTLVKDAQ